MAYSKSIVGPANRDSGVATWRITEDDVQTGSEWVISGLPTQCTITLFTSHLVVAGSASTIQPALGAISGWTIDGVGSISKASSADTDHVIGTKISAYLPTGQLFGKTTPDVNGAGRVITHVSIEPGHK